MRSRHQGTASVPYDPFVIKKWSSCMVDATPEHCHHCRVLVFVDTIVTIVTPHQGSTSSSKRQRRRGGIAGDCDGTREAE